MIRKRIYSPMFFLLVVLFTMQACSKKVIEEPQPPIVIQPPAAIGFVVAGYFPYYRTVSEIPDQHFRMYNVVNYAFFSVTASGGLQERNSSVFTALYAKAKAQGAKVFIAIDDASGDGSSNFKTMAATATGRNIFIREVMTKVRNYKLDGVDIDWEFPRTTDGSDVTFTALMKELSDSLHRDAKYYLTAAITPGKYAGAVRDAIKNELFSYVDWFNVMVYDDFSTTVSYKQHSDFALAQTSINYWINSRGMPSVKFVLGMPAYGRPSGITQSNTVLTYKAILLQGADPQSDSAIVTAGGFSNYTIYYNGQQTIKRKAMLAKQSTGGIMFWEQGQDATDNRSLIKAACDTIGRAY